MKLYWGPHTCAIGIQILLEEVRLPYETEQIDVEGGETHRPPFIAINPKGKVPTLVRDDGSVLTEFSAIATWIARQAPKAGLLPDDAEAEARVVEILAYVEGTIHGQGYGRIFAPSLFEPQDLVHGTLGVGATKVKQQGREMVEQGFSILDPALADRRFAVGDQFTIADAALFYVERWSPSHGITMPPNVQRHFEGLLDHPSVDRVRKLWGEA